MRKLAPVLVREHVGDRTGAPRLEEKPSSRLSANIVGMGYQIVAGTAHEDLSDEVWMDLISLASKHGFSAPRLGLLERRQQVDLSEEEATGLYAVLERALLAGEPAKHIAPEDDALDRDTVHRVRHVLGQPVLKMLRRTPPWR